MAVAETVNFSCPQCKTPYHSDKRPPFKVPCRSCSVTLTVVQDATNPARVAAYTDATISDDLRAGHEAIEEAARYKRDAAARNSAEERAERMDRLRQKEATARRLAEEKAHESEAARLREEAARRASEGTSAQHAEARRVAEERVQELEKEKAHSEDEKNQIQFHGSRLEKQLAEKKEARDEISRLREAAHAVRESYENIRRFPLLDADTQKARRNLVAVSAIAIALCFAPNISGTVTIAGLTLTGITGPLIMRGISGVTLFLLVVFILKAKDGVSEWRRLMFEATERLLKIGKDDRLDELRALASEEADLVRAYMPSAQAGVRRHQAVFADLVIPLALGVTGTVLPFLFWIFGPPSLPK